MLNGTGLRVVLWVSGCADACPGCQNPQTWEQMSGIRFDRVALDEIRAELQKDYIGTDIGHASGGDPLFPGNRRAVTRLLQTIREEFPDKTIWLYTDILMSRFALCLLWNWPMSLSMENISRGEERRKRRPVGRKYSTSASLILP